MNHLMKRLVCQVFLQRKRICLILAQVEPLSGPIEGNTVLAVIGQDIGRRFEDVVEVRVGDQLCDLAGLASEYQTGKRYGTRKSHRVAYLFDNPVIIGQAYIQIKYCMVMI